MRIRLELTPEETERLIELAALEKRPIHWQAEILLRRAMGLPWPPEALQAKVSAPTPTKQQTVVQQEQ